MSVLTAAVVLAWGCLLVLALAMAGMLRQLRELQAEVAQPRRHATTGRRVSALAGPGHLVLLVLDPGCGFCDTVHEPFTGLARDHPDIRFEVLSPRHRWPGAPDVRSRVDQRLITELDLPWAPALLHVDPDGTVLAGQPVWSAERLSGQVTDLLTTAGHR
ncbi:MAG: hypothetical protein ACRDSR_18365 [Pseudonocardiaceae bacterium]